MNRAATLLFDLDGTLTDNYVGISRSIVHAPARQRQPRDHALVADEPFERASAMRAFGRKIGDDARLRVAAWCSM